jgi:hypothetical protein
MIYRRHFFTSAFARMYLKVITQQAGQHYFQSPYQFVPYASALFRRPLFLVGISCSWIVGHELKWLVATFPPNALAHYSSD